MEEDTNKMEQNDKMDETGQAGGSKKPHRRTALIVVIIVIVAAVVVALAVGLSVRHNNRNAAEETTEEVDPDLEMGSGPVVEEEPEAEDEEREVTVEFGHGPAVEEEPEAEDEDGDEADSTPVTGPGPVITDGSETEDADFVNSLAVIEGYGFDNDEYSWRDYWSADYDYSPLSFSLTGGTVEDMGDYYTIQAVFNEPVKVPADLEPGESCTAVINKLTGETRTFTCVKEEGTGAQYYTTEDGWECYLTNIDDDGMAELLEGSADRLDAPFYDGVLWISKDAVTGAAITDGPFVTVTEDGLSEDDWFNVVAFDENGYVVQLIYEGD